MSDQDDERTRKPLTKERVLRAAIDLADEHGIRSLSMRKIGRRLGVEAMSLYKHVANKNDLLDGIVDIVFSEIDLPSIRPDWKASLRQRAISARAVLSRHPWAIGLMESRLQPGSANLRHHDAVIGCLREAGFSLPMAIHAYSALDAYIYGFALQEQSLPFETPDQAGEVSEIIASGFEADDYPYLSEAVVDYVSRSGYNFADEFEFGLDLLLDGLERLWRAQNRDGDVEWGTDLPARAGEDHR